jgi:hypothetical protein
VVLNYGSARGYFLRVSERGERSPCWERDRVLERLLTRVILLSRHHGSCGSMYTLLHVKIKILVYYLEMYFFIYPSPGFQHSLQNVQVYFGR